MNLFNVKEEFDAALVAEGLTLDLANRESTTDIMDGESIETYLGPIRLNERQVSGFISYTAEYIVNIVQAAEYAEGVETKSKEVAIADNFNRVVKAVFQKVSSSDADNIFLDNGIINTVVDPQYQCFAQLIFNLNVKTRI